MTSTRFSTVHFQLSEAWSSPFSRWHRSLQDINSIDLAARVTARALTDRGVDPKGIGELVLGITVPQQSGFYGAPTLAARIGAGHMTGAMVAQACATSVAGLAAAARTLELGASDPILVVMTDRTSLGPVITYPVPDSSALPHAIQENWVLHNFERDPWGGVSMAMTAEVVAQEAGISRQEADEVAILRHEQYNRALLNGFGFHRRFMIPVVADEGTTILDADEGVYPLDADATRSLVAGIPDGVVTRDTQTHPADGTAGLILRSANAGAGPRVRIHSVGFARTDRGRMPKAVVPAAREALAAAQFSIDDVHLVNTHNPFVISDIVFSRAFNFPVERMSTFGSSLVYGHPQAPTGMRSIIELAHALVLRGGGVGLFTGCAAGDTAGAVVIEVND